MTRLRRRRLLRGFALAITAFLLLQGCKRKPPDAAGDPPPSTRSDDPIPPPTKGAAEGTGRSKSSAEKQATPVTPPRPLTGDEARELARLCKWVKREGWIYEPNREYKRQRPVGLIVLRPEGFQGAVRAVVQYAEGLANAGWDVKFLIHTPYGPRERLDALDQLCKGLEKINAGVRRRNDAERAGLQPDVAPLNEIPVPMAFADSKELGEALDGWLRGNFVEFRASTETAPAARPPFGAISFLGHGKVVMKNLKLGAEESNLTHQFLTLAEGKDITNGEGDWYDLSALQSLILRKYQAPVWTMRDFCRHQKIGTAAGLPGDVPPAAVLGSRGLKPPPGFAGLKNIIDECENLRAKVSAGYRHGAGTGVTAMNATAKLEGIQYAEDKLWVHLGGAMLKRQPPPRSIDETPNPFNAEG